MIEGLWRDLRFGVRAHARTPIATVAIVATLSMGIAATTASFSITSAFFLRPLPIAEPDRFVRLYRYQAGTNARYFSISSEALREIRALTRVFETAFVEQPRPLIVGAAGSYERLWGEAVSDQYFTALGLRPALGRFFTAGGGRDAATVVLGDGVWTRLFGRDPGVLDRDLRIDGRRHRVIGVAPPGFRGTLLSFTSELWIPGAPEPSDGFALAKLRSGTRLEQARWAVEDLAVRLERQYPSTNAGTRFAVFYETQGRVPPPFHGGVVGFSVLLVAAALLVTALACANVAGVLLARGAARRAEIGVRAALGASRTRIVAQLLAESVPLSAAAGALGVLLAWQATRVLSAITVPLARGAQLSLDVGVDGRVLGVSLAATMLTGILCGLVPAIDGARSTLTTIRSSARGGELSRSGLGRVLLGAQVAVSMVLLAGGGLFAQSLRNAAQVDLGFDPAGVVTTSVDARVRNEPPERLIHFWTRLIEDVRRLPETESASLTARLPLELGIVTRPLAPEGFQPRDGAGWPSADFAVVDRGYFETLRIPLLDGRDFDERDTETSPPAIIVNDVIARQFWPDGRALGRTVVDGEGARFEVVGVVRRSKYLSVGEEPKPYVYFPLRQGRPVAMTIVAKGRGDTAAHLRSITDVVRRADATVPTYQPERLSDRVDTAMAPTAGAAAALGVVSVMALALTALGLFGSVGQAVSRRTYEIGVRRALGAPDHHVVWLVVRDTVAAATAGAGRGIAVAVPAAHLLRSLLDDVPAADPAVLGLAAATLLAVCAAAAALPAVRAIHVHAATALRHE